MKNNCNVAKDLMPLCIDGVASEESQQLISAHIEICEACATIYREMHDALQRQIEDENEQKSLATAAKRVRKQRLRRAVMSGVIGMVVGILAFLFIYNAKEIDFLMRYVRFNGDLKEGALFARVSSSYNGPQQNIYLTSTPSGSPKFETQIFTETVDDGAAVCIQVRAVYKGRDAEDEQYDAGGLISMGRVEDDVWVSWDSKEGVWLPVVRIELLSGNDVTVLWTLGDDVPTQHEVYDEERQLIEVSAL